MFPYIQLADHSVNWAINFDQVVNHMVILLQRALRGHSVICHCCSDTMLQCLLQLDNMVWIWRQRISV